MKISIPKADIERIMLEYGCTQEEATRAYLEAKEACGGIFERELAKKLGRRSGIEGRNFKIALHTPKEIKAHLDKYVIGQEEYKKRICIAAAYHFAMIQYLREHPEEKKVNRFRKKNTLIAGPSGSGKTYCIEVLGDFLDVPTLIVDATDYTEAGYVGKNSEEMIRELIDMAPGRNHKEQAEFVAQNGGIIFIDELDKKAKDGIVIGQDISREGFQRSVLKLLERKAVPIENPNSPVSQLQEAIEIQQHGRTDKKERMISTENILFILGGSFERSADSLESIIKKRLLLSEHSDEDRALVIKGFGTRKEDLEEKEFKNYLKEATASDYIRFGLLPELVGRSPIRTFVNQLSKNDLVRIMEETEDSIIDQYKLEFQLFNIELEITREAIDYVAEQAENKKTGARALVSVWENILTDFQFELPGSNFTRLVVARKLCEAPNDVLLKMLEKSPFVDFIENFKREYGIKLILEEDAQSYVEQEAKRLGMQISATLKKLLTGAVALNYMNVKGTYTITRQMLEDEKYFDRLFMDWYQRAKLPGSAET